MSTCANSMRKRSKTNRKLKHSLMKKSELKLRKFIHHNSCTKTSTTINTKRLMHQSAKQSYLCHLLHKVRKMPRKTSRNRDSLSRHLSFSSLLIVRISRLSNSNQQKRRKNNQRKNDLSQHRSPPPLLLSL